MKHSSRRIIPFNFGNLLATGVQCICEAMLRSSYSLSSSSRALVSVILLGQQLFAESKKSSPSIPPPEGAKAASGTKNTGSGYVIGSGDILQINVWHEPEASVSSTVVRTDGLISLPLIKEIQAAGFTPAELEKLITERLSKQIRNADVTVLVKEIHSEKIYLIGALKKEAQLVLKSPLTVLQAIAEAGGLTDYAKRNKIYVLRQEKSKQLRFPFDYPAVIRGEHMEQNIILKPGDTIVVPQ